MVCHGWQTENDMEVKMRVCSIPTVLCACALSMGLSWGNTSFASYSLIPQEAEVDSNEPFSQTDADREQDADAPSRLTTMARTWPIAIRLQPNRLLEGDHRG